MKEGCVNFVKLFRRKNAQVTIFIIIGIIIVAAGALIYSFYPEIKARIGGEEQTPQTYIQACIEDDIRDSAETIALQGGDIDPTNYIMYDNSKVQYLCYTNEYYRTCVVQQPLLKKHIELEIKKNVDDSIKSCFTSLKESYEKKGYDVELKQGDRNIELLPKRVMGIFNYSLTLSKGGETQRYDSFIVPVNNNIYELVLIANSIIEWEATYGDSEPTLYMNQDHNLKVEKNLRDSGDKVYVLTRRDTENKFQFATRGQIWPAGYAMPTV